MDHFAKQMEANSLSPGAPLVSSGTKNFHLLMTAEELARRDRLSALLCGPYPLPAVTPLLRLLPERRRKRFISRGVNVPADKIVPIWGVEVLQSVAFLIRKLRRKATTPSFLDRWTLSYYHAAASRAVRRLGEPGSIYHYRAGFGGASVAAARKKGMICLCDHSLADPRLLPYLVSGETSNPQVRAVTELDLVSQAMCADIEAADAVLVNSDFVRQTLIQCGYPAQRVHVVYLGVDEAFVRQLPPIAEHARGEDQRLKLCFAGFFSFRKGADTLIGALDLLPSGSWELSLAGAIDPTLRSRFPGFFDREEVIELGIVDRSRLADLMSKSEVFVFPTRAEGSARVLFEAMACGCYIITTREGGSIVEDGKHGAIVPANSSEYVAKAITLAAVDRSKTRQIGLRNRALVLEKHRQSHYGDGVIAVYDQLQRQSEVSRPGREK